MESRFELLIKCNKCLISASKVFIFNSALDFQKHESFNPLTLDRKIDPE